MRKTRLKFEMQVLSVTWQLVLLANPTNFRLVRIFPANKKFTLRSVERQPLHLVTKFYSNNGKTPNQQHQKQGGITIKSQQLDG